MDKATFGASTGTRREISNALRLTVAALGSCAVGLAAQAQALDGGVIDAAAESHRTESPVRLEVKASTLPRLDAQDRGFQAPRVDLSLLPPTRSSMGLALGMSGFAPAASALPLQATTSAQRPALDVGLRLRHTLETDHQIDVTAWRRMNDTQVDAHELALQQHRPLYGARVEMNLSPARKTGFAADRGFIGVQLDSGARITVKRKDGRPMLYYRNQF